MAPLQVPLVTFTSTKPTPASEVAAVMRKTGWFELGFTKAFLYELFARSGFDGRRVDCEPSAFGRLDIFERQPDAAMRTGRKGYRA